MSFRAGSLLLVTLLTSPSAADVGAASHRLARSKPRAAAPKEVGVASRLTGTYPVAAGVFLNWGRLVLLHGDQIDEFPQTDIVARWLAAGFADARADIREIGIVTPGDGSNRVAGMMTGEAEVERILRTAAATGVPFERSVHRGVTLHTSNVGKSVQVGMAGEGQLLFSVDQKDEHLLQKQTIETLAGQRASYAASHSLDLPEDYIAHAGAKIRAIRPFLKYLGDFGRALQESAEVAGTLTSPGADADSCCLLRFTMTGEDEAEQLEIAMRPWLEDLVRNAPPAYRELLRSVDYDRQGKTLLVTLTLAPGWVALLVRAWS